MVCCRQALFMAMPYYLDDVSKLFANASPTKVRPFLVISEDEDTFTAVNVTSDKLKMDNIFDLFGQGYIPLRNHHPPF
ncbi:MAG: hypothetical protein LBE57_05475 [Methanosarcinales archaeon]|jgi:hypothetical protein|nr:hypothetical protein [Methanosarcinales archaeon]